MKINGINKYTSERRDSGDIILCTPPRKDIIKTKALRPKDPDMHKLVYFTNNHEEKYNYSQDGQYNYFQDGQYHYFQGPEYLFGLVSGSSTCYYSVTINFTGTYSGPSYTITSANSTELTGILIKNPAPASRQLPSDAICPDLYDTHDWEIRTSYFNGGWSSIPSPILFLIRRGNGCQ